MIKPITFFFIKILIQEEVAPNEKSEFQNIKQLKIKFYF